MDKKKIIIWSSVILVCLIIITTTIAVIVHKTKSNNNEVVDEPVSGESSGEESGDSGEEEEVYNGPVMFSGDARPVAVMIDNEKGAWPQAGLNDAYMIYEITVEGGETRFIAFFKGKNTEKIGPVRSSRHYFLDYVMEHDALYAHFGWSPLAQSDIPRLGINNINGIYDTYYWREPPLSSYHNAFTSMEKMMKAFNGKGYRTTSSQECIIKYNKKDTDLESEMPANKIDLKYSYFHTTSYVYDKDRKVYLRSMRGIEHRDRWTNEQFYAKNIIVMKIRNTLLNDPENKGRQELYNTGSGKGFYITNGEYIPITWKKESRAGKTTYYDQDDNEITFNDGITWVQIVPTDGTVTIE